MLRERAVVNMTHTFTEEPTSRIRHYSMKHSCHVERRQYEGSLWSDDLLNHVFKAKCNHWPKQLNCNMEFIYVGTTLPPPPPPLPHFLTGFGRIRKLTSAKSEGTSPPQSPRGATTALDHLLSQRNTPQNNCSSKFSHITWLPLMQDVSDFLP